MLKRLFIIILISVFLIGCKTTEQAPNTPAVINHPTWPTPILPYTFQWKVIQVEDEVYVGLEYNQSLEFRVFLEDLKRYIKESNSLICFYREDLKESRCFTLNPVDKKSD